MEGTIGEIRLFAGNFAPRNWAFCDGSEVDIQTNAALFSIVGITYGGDGRTTFKLPNLSGNGPESNDVEVKYIICTNGLFPSRP